jgi:hypothetical protein
VNQSIDSLPQIAAHLSPSLLNLSLKDIDVGSTTTTSLIIADVERFFSVTLTIPVATETSPAVLTADRRIRSV